MRVVISRIWRSPYLGPRASGYLLGTKNTVGPSLHGDEHHHDTRLRVFADPREDPEGMDQSETLREQQSVTSRLTEKLELGVQGALALAFGAALAVSAANILFKVGVIAFALVTVAMRYTIVGILLVVLVACVL